MASESMNDFTVAQKMEVETSVNEVHTALSAMKTLAESSNVDPSGEMFSSYLASWNKQEVFQISYAPLEEIEVQLQSPSAVESDKATFERLKAGESVVSDVRKSERLGGYYYSIATPVIKDDRVVGALRSIASAEELLATNQSSSQVALVGSVLIKNDGEIVADSEETEPYNGKNLYTLLRDVGFSEEVVDGARGSVENDKDVTTAILGAREGKMLFLTSIRLGINDWNIVNITQEDAMAQHSQVILQGTIVTGSILIGISILACVTVALVVLRSQHRALREAKRYAVLTEFSDTVLFEYSYLDDRLELTPNARELFLLDVLQRNHYLKNGTPLVDIHEDDCASVKDLIASPAGAGETKKISLRARAINGEYRWYSCVCRYLYDGADPFAAVGKITDITQERALEDQLKNESQIDGLTKIFNKITSERLIQEQLGKNEPGLLFIIDVDRFKLINDELGHSVGDRVLAGVARALSAAFRQDDIVGRMGGDEFIAYANDASSEEIVATKREVIDRHIEEVSRELQIPLALSVGVAAFPEEGTTLQVLFESADAAMYEEKRRHKKEDGLEGKDGR